jgi:glycosyltransferase involved in cell wall biosynthesis
MEKLPISVVIVAKNAESTLTDCLNSVIHNNPAEIIVIDGNSTDNTVNIAKKYTDLIYSDNCRGLCYARQLGAEKAKQEYIAYVDADIIFLNDNALSTMLNEFKGMGFVSIRAQETRKRNYASYWEWGQSQQLYYSRLRNRQDYLSTMACIIRKEIVLKYKFDTEEKFMDDLDLGMRLAKAGYKFGTSTVFVDHRHNSRITFKSFFRYQCHLGWVAWQYIRKHGFWHISLWAPAVSLYWLLFFLLKLNIKIIPYIIIQAIAYNTGWFKGLFDIIKENFKITK